MSFEFSIPLSRDDLTKKTGIDQYVVDEVFSVRILPSKVQECKAFFRTKGPLAILSTFDNLYSILRHFYDVNPEMKEDTWDILLKAIPAHANQLVEFLDGGQMDLQLRSDHLNALKMNCYLLAQFIDIFECEVTKPSATITGRGKKKSVRPSAELGNIDWDHEREMAVRALLQLLQLNVNRLWDPPVAEEEFVNLIANCCYKLLENPNVCKNKTTKEVVFQLLGTMAKKYNHTLGCSLKIIQLLQHFEHLASPLASAVELIAQDFGIKSIAGEIMREIGRIDPKDLARDTSGTRAFAAFLVELAEKIPSVMLPSISVILGLLDGESYTMRNSVLGVLSEMIVRVLSKEGLAEKEKNTRDQFLDKLEDHIHDVHAFVRSKVLQIWLHVINEKALPLPRQHTLLELVIGRLKDRSSSVRKYAIQVVTALLRNNPFAAKFSLDEVTENYEKEKAKLDAMMPEKVEDTPEDKARKEAEELWSKLAPDLKKAIQEFLKSEQSGEDLINDEDTPDGIKDRILKQLKSDELNSAVQLFNTAVESWPGNPYFKAGVPTLTDKENEAEEEPEQDEAKSSALIEGLKVVYFCETLSTIIEAATVQGTPESSQPTSEANEITKQQVLVQYLKDSMNFLSSMQKSIPTISQLLGSKSITDVLEATDFFVTGFEFGLSNAMIGIRRMLALVWSKEQSIKEAVVGAYKRLYLNMHVTEGNARSKALAVANNLIALTFGATVGDLTSMEELISEFVRNGELDQRVIQVLWEKFAMKIGNTTSSESRGSLQLLGMAAGAQVEIVKSNIDVLVKEGLGSRGEEDFLLTRDTCLALHKLGGTKKAIAGKYEEPFKFPQEHEIFSRLSHILVTGVGKLEQNFWIPMAEQAINVIYKLAEHPDVICGDIIKKIANKVMTWDAGTEKNIPVESSSQKEETTNEDGSGDSEEISSSQQSPPASQFSLSVPSGVLTRFLSVSGHIALRELVHLDVAVFGEMKRRHAVQEAAKEGEKEGSALNKSGKNRTMNTTSATARRRSLKNLTTQGTEDLETEEEMGLAGAAAEDAEAEYIRKLTETELVNGTNLLAVIRPLLVTVCNNQVKYPDPELRAAASLALAKFMMVSSEFCDDHLQLLFTIMEKSPHPTIRANCIIALGDLNFRFPNLLEPWTPHLYARLRDDSPRVRKNTLMVLTHLILNDMVKVKGQISELATCIVDEDTRIAGLSKLFFHELARKGNAIYNIMPDMISRLSDPEIGVEEEHFRLIMKYLFSFIQKDRQCESLVEKLCHRFKATKTERQWRDLAYCLSMLSYNEKSLRKLQENLNCFADKLHEEEVYNCFILVISGAKKFAKPEAKLLVDEFEEKLEQCHSKGVEDEEASNKATNAQVAARALKSSNGRKTPAKTPGKRGLKGKAKQKPTLELSDDEDEEIEEPEIHPAKRDATKKSNKPKLSFSSDEEDFEEECAQTQTSKDKAGKDTAPTLFSDGENVDPNSIDGASSSPEVTALKSKLKHATPSKNSNKSSSSEAASNNKTSPVPLETSTRSSRRTRKAPVK